MPRSIALPHSLPTRRTTGQREFILLASWVGDLLGMASWLRLWAEGPVDDLRGGLETGGGGEADEGGVGADGGRNVDGPGGGEGRVGSKVANAESECGAVVGDV